MDAKQVNNAEGNQDGFAISTLKKILKKEGTTMGLVSVNCVTGDYRFGGYVYGRWKQKIHCLLYTSPSPRDGLLSRMPSSA